MKFDDAASVDQIAFEMRLADYPRSLDRQRINDLFNGLPPYSEDERERNGIAINVNFLEGTRLAHDARMQFAGNFLKPGKYFTARTDMGPAHKRTLRSNFVTRELAKMMKRSIPYYETFRSKFALNVLHGIGPSCWDTPDHWCPDAIGIEDVMVPSNTLLHMKNLPLFTLYHSYTAPELIRLTRNREVAEKAGWDLGLVDQCVKWLDQETMALSHSNWPETWSPEKMGERIKSDGGCYASDSVPTIDCFDFYFWNDDGDEEGWCRRIVLDSWSTPQSAGGTYSMQRDNTRDFGRNQFLFTSGNRKVASSWRNIVTWQFADLSAVAPFRYHSVRSLGLLLYAVCNLQNRLRCRFNECVWESTLMYLRVKSQEDIQRALKVELVNRGFIDESISFVPAAERFQVNDRLLQEGLAQNQQLIQQSSASYTQTPGQSRDRTEKTKFQVMAEIQSMTAMISAALQQAYRYQEMGEYQEIKRRVFLRNSRDPDIQLFQGACLRFGIPESMMVAEAWEVEAERVLGAGNKTLEMAIAEQLMQYRNLYDPEPQREILRDVTLAITDDPARAESLVPEAPVKITDSVHDAQISAAALMMGLPVELKTGMNHIEYVDTMLKDLGGVIMKYKKQGNMAPPDKIEGMQNLANHIGQHIQLVAQDENEKGRVTKWQKMLTSMMNEVKGFQQRLQKAMEAQQQDSGGNGEAQAKIRDQKMQAEAKMANTRESHAQRTAQREIQFQMEQKRDQQRHQFEMQKEAQRASLELRAQQAKTATELKGKRAERMQEIGARRLEQAQELVHEDRKSKMQTAKKKTPNA